MFYLAIFEKAECRVGETVKQISGTGAGAGTGAGQIQVLAQVLKLKNRDRLRRP